MVGRLGEREDRRQRLGDKGIMVIWEWDDFPSMIFFLKKKILSKLLLLLLLLLLLKVVFKN